LGVLDFCTILKRRQEEKRIKGCPAGVRKHEGGEESDLPRRHKIKGKKGKSRKKEKLEQA